MSGEEVNYTSSSEDMTEKLAVKTLDLNAGLLGKLFGSPETAPSNIAGLVISVLLIIGIVGFFKSPAGTSPLEIWKVITPIITMILGYLFGKNH